MGSNRFSQVGVYIGKCFRIFWHEKGWKVVLFGAIISAIIAWVPGDKMFVYKVNTKNGAFAIVCACIWIGLFNSIQSICRERKIIKREHRTGLHISSYILAHMIYELCICFIQSIIMVLALFIFRNNIPKSGVILPGLLELFISCLLIMYASDVLGIAVSSFVKNENAAMAAMPFVLIVQLVLAGIIFELEGSVNAVSNVTISKWGVQAICSTCDINHMQDAFTVLQIETEEEQMEEALDRDLKDSEIEDIEEKYMDQQLEDDERTDDAYDSSPGVLLSCWMIMIVYTILYGVISVLALKMVDKDKR